MVVIYYTIVDNVMVLVSKRQVNSLGGTTCRELTGIKHTGGALLSSLTINAQLQSESDPLHSLKYTVNPGFKPQGLINFMVHNQPGSNRDY